MQFLFSIIGVVGAFAMIVAGITYLANPAMAKKLVTGVAMRLSVLLGALVVISEVFHQTDGVGVVLALLVISPIAYAIRERRLRRPERTQKLGGAERTPVVPHRPGGGE